MGKFLIITGLLLLVAGLILTYAPGLFSWFGKLPGDILIKDEHTTIFIPFTSMIIISLLLTLILNLFNS